MSRTVSDVCQSLGAASPDEVDVLRTPPSGAGSVPRALAAERARTWVARHRDTSLAISETEAAALRSAGARVKPTA